MAARVSRPGLFWSILMVVILAYTVGLSVGPRLDEEKAREHCLTSIDLPGPFGILLNCDSPELMKYAAHPEKLLEPGNVRQSRPGEIWLAWMISKAVSVFAPIFVNLASRDSVKLPEGKTRTRAQSVAELAPVFIAYYLINIILLVSSVWLLRRAAMLVNLDIDVAGLAFVLLLFNDVTKAFLITPHIQLMNICVPLLFAVFLFQWLASETIRAKTVIGVSALAGAGVLAYATWLLVPAVICIGIALAWFRGGEIWRDGRRILLLFPVVIALTIVPYTLWYGYIINVAGYFYQHEITRGGLVWIFRSSPMEFLTQLVGNIWVLLTMAATQAGPYVVFVLPAILFLLCGTSRLSESGTRILKLAVLAAALTSTLFLIFFAVTGFRIWRYAVPLLPPWVLPIGLLNSFVFEQIAPGQKRRLFIILLCVIGILVALHQVAKNGPWS